VSIAKENGLALAREEQVLLGNALLLRASFEEGRKETMKAQTLF